MLFNTFVNSNDKIPSPFISKYIITTIEFSTRIVEQHFHRGKSIQDLVLEISSFKIIPSIVQQEKYKIVSYNF